jgi:hypothetical protein
MFFKYLLLFSAGLLCQYGAVAAEWKAEPALNLSSVYNDNIGIRSNNVRNSTGYTVAPGLELRVQEPNWDVGFDARVKVTRYNDIDDADSDNYFFNLKSGYATERHKFRLSGSFSRNNTFDTDYDTELDAAGRTDDHTEQETTIITPLWEWQMSESSTVSVALSSSDIEYDEVTSGNYLSYRLNGITIGSSWSLSKVSNVGLQFKYEAYESEKAPFEYQTVNFENYRDYEKFVYQFTYGYQMSERSNVNMTLGTRKIESTIHDIPVGCSLPNPFIPDGCFVYTIGDSENSEDGVEASFDYHHSTEVSLLKASVSRAVQPSIFGGAQEEKSMAIQYQSNISERLSGRLILDAKEIKSVDEFNSQNDYRRYRFEPRLAWRLKKDWVLSVAYRHIRQQMIETNDDGDSNIIYVSLGIFWPRLASTY